MKTIIALLMFVGEPQQLKEMTYINSLSECLKKKRIATRNSGQRVNYVCSKVKAKLSADNKILSIDKM